MAEKPEVPDDEHATLLEEIRTRYKVARDHASTWREEARQCFDFYAGHQWSEDEEAAMEDKKRPALVFNRTGPFVDAVLGHENNNRNELRFMPRTMGDAAVNEKLSEASRYFIDECDGEHEQSDAFRDMLVSGMGWTEVRLSDDGNPEYDLIVERVDPLEMLWDPSSKKPNLADARYFFRRKRMAREEIKAIWPTYEPAGASDDWAEEGEEDHDAKPVNPRTSYQGDGDKSAKRDILVIEYQWRDVEPFYLVEKPARAAAPADDGAMASAPPQPEQFELAVDDYDDQREEIEKLGGKAVLKRRNQFKRAFVIGNELVDQSQPYPEGFTYTAMTGKRDRNKGHWFGLVRAMRDPQEWSNKWLSQIMHILNANAKGGVMVEKGAVVNVHDFEEKWASPEGIIWVADDAVAKNRIKERGGAFWPAGFDKLLEYANQSFGDVSGVNQELLGMADREQPGVLEWQRKQSAVSLLAPLFDSLRRYRMMMGRVWLYFIQHYVSDGRLIRITTDDGEQYVPLTPEWSGAETAKYDVIVDQSASAPNQKEATWAVLTTLLPVIGEIIAPEDMMLALEHSPLPDSFVAKLKANQAKRAEQPPPPDPEMVKVQAQLQAKQQEAQIDAQLKQQEMQIEVQIEQQKLQLEREKAQAEIDLEREKARAELELQQMKMQGDMQMQQMKASADMQFQREKTDGELDLQRHKADGEMEIKAATAIEGFDGETKANGKAKPQPRVFKVFGDISTKLDELKRSQIDTSALTKELQDLREEVAGPREIVRGTDGRAVGVRTARGQKNIIRGPDGRATGVQ